MHREYCSDSYMAWLLAKKSESGDRLVEALRTGDEGVQLYEQGRSDALDQAIRAARIGIEAMSPD